MGPSPGARELRRTQTDNVFEDVFLSVQWAVLTGWKMDRLHLRRIRPTTDLRTGLSGKRAKMAGLECWRKFRQMAARWQRAVLQSAGWEADGSFGPRCGARIGIRRSRRPVSDYRACWTAHLSLRRDAG